MKHSSFHPPARVLMGPGPSDTHPRVLEAVSRPTIGHLDPEFIRLMDEIKSLLQYAFQTDNEYTLVTPGPGTAGMETLVVDLVEPGDRVLVCINGFFGTRLREMVERCGGEAIPVDFEWGRAIDPQKLEDSLRQHPDVKIVAFVHAETSSGALSDAQTLTEIAHQHDCIVLMDAVTSLGGLPLKVDEWSLDAVYSGSQKCLSSVPGLSPVTLNERAVEKIRSRKTPVQSFFMDVELLMKYWGGHSRRAYHHTAPINSLYGFHEALVILQEEGLENAWRRHRENHELLKEELQELGLEFFVPEAERLPNLNAVRIPEGIDDATVRSRLLQEFNLEIGAGLGPLAGKIWRIGLMGYSSSRKNVLYCVSALREVLNR